METNSKSKVKFNWLDVVIILFVALVILVGYKYFNKTSSKAGSNESITYVIELQNKDGDYKEQIKVGDEIKDGIKGGYFGVVKDVRYEATKTISEASDRGEFVETEIPERFNYYITVEGTPTTFTDSKIMFASQEIKVGNTICIKSKNYAGEGFVVDINLD